MDLISLDNLLGEFRPYYDNKLCNFGRIVTLTLCSAEGWRDLGNLDRAKIHYDRLTNYLEAVKARADIRERELAEIRLGLFLKANVGPDADAVIQEYLSEINSQLT